MLIVPSSQTYMVCRESGDGTPQSCTSAIPEMDFSFGNKNPTDISQLAPLRVGVSNNLLLFFIYANYFVVFTSKVLRDSFPSLK